MTNFKRRAELGDQAFDLTSTRLWRPRTDRSGLPVLTAADLAHVPGKAGLPVLGTLPEAVLGPLAFAKRMTERYGPVHRFFASGSWNVQLIGPEANELVLFDQARIFSAEHGWGPVLKQFFPGALLVRDGDDHRIHRRLIGGAFKPQQLRGYLDIFGRDVERSVEAWSGRRIEGYAAVKQLMLDSAATSFFGVPLGPEADEVNRAFTGLMGSTIAVVPPAVPRSAAAKGLAGQAHMTRFIEREIPNRRANPGRDLFSQLCTLVDDDGRPLPDKDVVELMIFVLAAAHDTITSSNTSMLYYLATNPEWQDRLRAELLSVAAPGEPIPIEAFSKLEATERFIKEVLRLNPPAPIVWRRATQPYSIGGYDLPAGTITGVNPLLSHRLPEHWPDPERFDPDRFLPEAVAARHRFAYVPFGGGIHMCLGLHYSMMQTKLVLHRLLAEHRVELPDGYRPRWYWWPNCRPLNGLPVTVARLA